MARVAIKTKYLGPTTYLSARIKATAMDAYSDGKPLTITKPVNHVFNAEETHRGVAEELIPQLYNPNNYSDVQIELIAGATQGGDYVFVAVNKQGGGRS
jgi:hypothetical protein